MIRRLINKYRYKRAKKNMLYFFKLIKFDIPEHYRNDIKVLERYHNNDLSVHKAYFRIKDKRIYNHIRLWQYLKKHNRLISYIKYNRTGHINKYITNTAIIIDYIDNKDNTI